MGKGCVVCGISFKDNCHISFHMIPKNKSKRQNWMDKLNLSASDFNTYYNYVCEKHFTKDCFKQNRVIKQLKNNSYPTLYPKMRHVNKDCLKSNSSDKNSFPFPVPMVSPSVKTDANITASSIVRVNSSPSTRSGHTLSQMNSTIIVDDNSTNNSVNFMTLPSASGINKHIILKPTSTEKNRNSIPNLNGTSGVETDVTVTTSPVIPANFLESTNRSILKPMSSVKVCDPVIGGTQYVNTGAFITAPSVIPASFMESAKRSILKPMSADELCNPVIGGTQYVNNGAIVNFTPILVGSSSNNTGLNVNPIPVIIGAFFSNSISNSTPPALIPCSSNVTATPVTSLILPGINIGAIVTEHQNKNTLGPHLFNTRSTSNVIPTTNSSVTAGTSVAPIVSSAINTGAIAMQYQNNVLGPYLSDTKPTTVSRSSSSINKTPIVMPIITHVTSLADSEGNNVKTNPPRELPVLKLAEVWHNDAGTLAASSVIAADTKHSILKSKDSIHVPPNIYTGEVVISSITSGDSSEKILPISSTSSRTFTASRSSSATLTASSLERPTSFQSSPVQKPMDRAPQKRIEYWQEVPKNESYTDLMNRCKNLRKKLKAKDLLIASLRKKNARLRAEADRLKAILKRLKKKKARGGQKDDVKEEIVIVVD